MAQVFCLGGPHDSEDTNLPVKSVLGGQIDFQRDKVGDTDPSTLFVRFVSLCDTLMLGVL
jgi:hypothetical protein